MGTRRERPLVLGHRGYRARFPENTLLAFREALSAGADGIECDVQRTRDGRYVIIHDPGTERVTGVSRGVAASSAGELRELDAGRGERIPFLEEMLDVLPAEAWLDVELKEETLTVSDAGPIADILDARRRRDRLMVSSFSAPLLVPFRRRGFAVGFLVGEEMGQRGLAALVGVIARLRPQFLNLPVESLRVLGERRAARFFRVLRWVGVRLLFWTVNDPQEARRLSRWARFLVTDEVGQLLKTTDS